MRKMILFTMLNLSLVAQAETAISNSNIQINSVNNGIQTNSNTGSIVIDGIDIRHHKNTQGVVSGSGRKSTVTRKIDNFTVLISKVSTDVQVRLGRPAKLTIKGDDNMIPLIKTEINGGVLQISALSSYMTANPLLIIIDIPQIESVRLDGSGEIRLSGVDNKTLSLALQGSGDIQASGRVTALDVEMNGAGDVDLSELMTVNSKVSIAGAGDADINVTGELDVLIEGSGDVTYSGSPKKIRRNITGSGEVVAR